MSNLRVEQKSNMKNSVSRMVFAGISVLFQVLWFIFIVYRLNQYTTLITFFSSLAALTVTLWMFGRHTNEEIKMTWIAIILAFPILGISLYLLFGRPGTSRRKKKEFDRAGLKVRAAMRKDASTLQELEKENVSIANQFRYLENYANYPVYSNTDVTYYSDTCEALEAQKEAMRQAKSFIFLECFAI